MKRHVILFVIVTFGISVWAQGRGTGGQGGRGTGQGAQMGAGGANSSAGIRQQDRLRIHATDQQRDRYRSCSETTQRLRQHLRTLSRLGRGATLGAADAARYREQIRNEFRATLQEREQWMASLSAEQRNASQEEASVLTQRTARLQDSLNALDLALMEDEIEQERVRQLAGTADSQLRSVQRQQRELAEAAGLQP